MSKGLIMLLEKYSASGNDFLITHFIPQGIDLSKLAIMLCNRFEGIGADGLALLSPHPSYAYQWDFYNCDGSRASMCGNASRCAGLYAYFHQLGGQKHQFLSQSRGIEIEILSSSYPYKVQSVLGPYKLLQKIQNWFLIDTGVPHLVCLLENKKAFDAFELEEMRHLRALYDANVNIAYKEQNIFWIKTYERGVEGITLSCGTGMASLVALLKESNKLHSPFVEIIPPLGKSLIFTLRGEEISFEGEVQKIAECKINLKEFGITQ